MRASLTWAWRIAALAAILDLIFLVALVGLPRIVSPEAALQVGTIQSAQILGWRLWNSVHYPLAGHLGWWIWSAPIDAHGMTPTLTQLGAYYAGCIAYLGLIGYVFGTILHLLASKRTGPQS